MEWQLSSEERGYLRGLAKKQAEYAALPIMGERKKMWYELNDGRGGTRVPMIVETWTFDRDFMPESIFRCAPGLARGIERQLLRNIRNHELLDDDKVMPDYFPTHWFMEVDEFGVKIEAKYIADSEGVDIGHEFIHPIKDLSRDLELLKPAVCKVDREKSFRYRDFIRELFDGILDVRIEGGLGGYSMLTQRVVKLMGMEAYFMAMLEEPEKMHQLMAFLRDNCLRIWKWLEQEKLLRANHANHQSFGSSYNFTTRLNTPTDLDTPVGLSDIFGASNSQETVGLSAAMYHEFCFPYYRDVAEPLGLLYYGCCEPVHPFWEDVVRYPHLKKVSISRWCDEGFVGERLRGTDIVFSRKPDPNFLGADQVLREDAWRSHIAATLRAAQGVQLEILVRDVYTVHGNLGKPRRAIEIAREEIAKAGRG